MAATWAKENIVADMAAHQKREWWSRFTMISEPIPEDSRPRNEQTEMIDTCSN